MSGGRDGPPRRAARARRAGARALVPVSTAITVVIIVLVIGLSAAFGGDKGWDGRRDRPGGAGRRADGGAGDRGHRLARPRPPDRTGRRAGAARGRHARRRRRPRLDPHQGQARRPARRAAAGGARRRPRRRRRCGSRRSSRSTRDVRRGGRRSRSSSCCCSTASCSPTASGSPPAWWRRRPRASSRCCSPPIRPRQLLAGKVIGLGLLGLGHLCVIASSGWSSAPRPARSTSTASLVGAAALALLWFVAGYAFYSCAVRLRGRARPAPGGAAVDDDAADAADPRLVLPLLRGQRQPGRDARARHRVHPDDRAADDAAPDRHRRRAGLGDRRLLRGHARRGRGADPARRADLRGRRAAHRLRGQAARRVAGGARAEAARTSTPAG